MKTCKAAFSVSFRFMRELHSHIIKKFVVRDKSEKAVPWGTAFFIFRYCVSWSLYRKAETKAAIMPY